MYKEKVYDRDKALAYAEKWALTRNPRYLSLNGMGGDCTNFTSQCIYAGCSVMNYTRDIGWYYNSASDRAAAWTGVPYLHRFLLSNKAAGPYAQETMLEQLEPGDIIQLGNANGKWYHSLLLTGFSVSQGPLVSTHTFDAHLRPLSTYSFAQIRFLHILGARG